MQIQVTVLVKVQVKIKCWYPELESQRPEGQDLGYCRRISKGFAGDPGVGQHLSLSGSEATGAKDSGR